MFCGSKLGSCSHDHIFFCCVCWVFSCFIEVIRHSFCSNPCNIMDPVYSKDESGPRNPKQVLWTYICLFRVWFFLTKYSKKFHSMIWKTHQDTQSHQVQNMRFFTFFCCLSFKDETKLHPHILNRNCTLTSIFFYLHDCWFCCKGLCAASSKSWKFVFCGHVEQSAIQAEYCVDRSTTSKLAVCLPTTKSSRGTKRSLEDEPIMMNVYSTLCTPVYIWRIAQSLDQGVCRALSRWTMWHDEVSA